MLTKPWTGRAKHAVRVSYSHRTARYRLFVKRPHKNETMTVSHFSICVSSSQVSKPSHLHVRLDYKGDELNSPRITINTTTNAVFVSSSKMQRNSFLAFLAAFTTTSASPVLHARGESGAVYFC